MDTTRRPGGVIAAIALAATEEMNQNNIRKGLEDTLVMGEKSWMGPPRRAVAIHTYLAVAFDALMKARYLNHWCLNWWTD